MAKTLIDIGEEALAAAMTEYGTTKVDTVNRALREVAARRKEKTERFMRMALEVSDQLAECDVRKEAWR
jgi:Arc/MetJ family transcription regulator